MTKTDSGLEYRDIEEGTGPTPEEGQTCFVHYTGWLWVDGKKGKNADRSRHDGQRASITGNRHSGGNSDGVMHRERLFLALAQVQPDHGRFPDRGRIPSNFRAALAEHRD